MPIAAISGCARDAGREFASWSAVCDGSAKVWKAAMSKMFEDLRQGLAEVDAFLGGEKAGYKVTLPAEIDVKSIRKGLNMTQAGFSDAFGFTLDAVKHWEGGRRTPEASARAFLTVIARNPDAVISALHPFSRPCRTFQWRMLTQDCVLG
jgi:putative transcriptional regulator